MDIEGVEVLWLVSNLQHRTCEIQRALQNLIRKLRETISEASNWHWSTPITERKALPLKDLVQDAEETKELVQELKNLKTLIETEKAALEEHEVKWAIREIDSWTTELEKTPRHEFAYDEDWVYQILNDAFLRLNTRIRDLILGIKTRYDNKITQLNNLAEFNFPQLKTDLETIEKSYAAVRDKLLSGAAKKFLYSSEATFAYAMNHLTAASEAQWAILGRHVEIHRERAETCWISAVMFLVSAHEKIICALAYELGATHEEKDITYAKALSEIDCKTKKLWKQIERADRVPIIQGIRNLRHAETHRFSDYNSVELQGSAQTMIKEIRRVLHTIDEYLSNSIPTATRAP